MGGKTFTDKITGINPASRIPNHHIQRLSECVSDEYACFFDQCEMVSNCNLSHKKDNGDIDFVVLKNKRSLELLYDYVSRNNIRRITNGNMVHILYPFGPTDNSKTPLYQVDFICVNDPEEYEITKFYYSNPIVFNATVGHFARSIGYKFSTKGLLLHITDKRKQNYYIEMSRNLDTILKLLCLNKDISHIYDSPEDFVSWLTSSPRYGSELMDLAENKNAHRDAKIDSFCGDVYKLLEKVNIKEKNPPSKIDFSDEKFSLSQALEFERGIIGNEIVDKVIELCEEKMKVESPIISGNVLIELGYKQGPIFKEIIQDVSSVFTKDENINNIKKYILDKYILDKYNNCKIKE